MKKGESKLIGDSGWLFRHNVENLRVLGYFQLLDKDHDNNASEAMELTFLRKEA